MTEKQKLYAGAALALAVAAAGGFGIARITGNDPQTEATVEKPAAASDEIAINEAAIKTSQITIAPAQSGDVGSAIAASATVEATPDAEALLTARAPGTVTRIFKRIGDPVGAGETLALVESRDASDIVADRAAASARVGLAKRQLDREATLLKQGVSPRADYETAQANLAVAQAEASRASGAAGAVRLARDGRSIMVVSPVSGRVTAAPASLGQFVAAETELFRVADPRRLQIAASVPPADAARVRAGDKVELKLSDGTMLEGRVRSSTGVVDPNTRSATVIIDAGGAGANLVPGQLVQTRIFASVGSAEGGVMVPQDAVQTIGSRSVVFVRTAKGFKAQTVEIGSRSNGLVSIVSGLKAGTPIATTNAFLLKAELEKESAE